MSLFCGPFGEKKEVSREIHTRNPNKCRMRKVRGQEREAFSQQAVVFMD